MKRFLACVCMIALLLSSVSVFAAEDEIMLITEEATETEATSTEAAEDVLLIAPAPASVPSEWAAEEVTKAAEAGLLAGLEKVDYQKSITRAEFAKLIVNCVTPVLGLSAEEIVGDNTTQFTDIDDVSVNTAALLGIVNGVGDGLFAPEKEITRQEIAVMMHRATNTVSVLLDKVYLSAEAVDLAEYTDADAVAEWAKTAVSVLAANDVMKGVSETELAPLSATTVEQAILLATRIFALMQ